ncbi:hypothetical protein ACU5JM_08360 [Rhodococcus erythropolis]|uniref:hypothetical protein n=1 Tax=Rhodococcus erythropolis TaxID=1833 RepID=UPI00406BC96F
MTDPTKPTTNLTREDIRVAIYKFDLSRASSSLAAIAGEMNQDQVDAQYDKDIDRLMQLIDTYTQAKEREARMGERIRYKQTLESAIETYPIDNDWCRGRRQGIQDCIDDQTEIISELAALKTKQEVAN